MCYRGISHTGEKKRAALDEHAAKMRERNERRVVVTNRIQRKRAGAFRARRRKKNRQPRWVNTAAQQRREEYLRETGRI